MAQVLAVDPDVGVVIDAVEFDEDRAVAISFVQMKCFSIPADTARREAV
jgi:hypothetical protein